MASATPRLQQLPLRSVHLDVRNPRHPPFGTQTEAIDYLCREEDVVALARDIAKNGLNPLEAFAVIPERGGRTYFVAEGNRRLCALMLLKDPDRAPTAKLQKSFHKLAKDWGPISRIPAIAFSDRATVKLWLDRIHGGPDGGRGRKPWNSEQKSRNTPHSKNNYAQAVLDLAERRGLISDRERKGRLSTAEKYLRNPVLRQTVGLYGTKADDLRVDLPDEEFERVFAAFIRDIAMRAINTRTGQVASDIEAYATKLKGRSRLTGMRTDPRSLTSSSQARATPSDVENIEESSEDEAAPTKPTLPPPVSRVPHSVALEDGIRDLDSLKLAHIYYSLTTIDLDKHTQLLYLAAWALLESLTKAKGSTVSIAAFMNPKLRELGVPDVNSRSVKAAIARIVELGNATKHDPKAGGFHGQQLANDIQVITPALERLVAVRD